MRRLALLLAAASALAGCGGTGTSGGPFGGNTSSRFGQSEQDDRAPQGPRTTRPAPEATGVPVFLSAGPGLTDRVAWVGLRKIEIQGPRSSASLLNLDRPLWLQLGALRTDDGPSMLFVGMAPKGSARAAVTVVDEALIGADGKLQARGLDPQFAAEGDLTKLQANLEVTESGDAIILEVDLSTGASGTLPIGLAVGGGDVWRQAEKQVACALFGTPSAWSDGAFRWNVPGTAPIPARMAAGSRERLESLQLNDAPLVGLFGAYRAASSDLEVFEVSPEAATSAWAVGVPGVPSPASLVLDPVMVFGMVPVPGRMRASGSIKWFGLDPGQGDLPAYVLAIGPEPSEGQGWRPERVVAVTPIPAAATPPGETEAETPGS